MRAREELMHTLEIPSLKSDKVTKENFVNGVFS